MTEPMPDDETVQDPDPEVVIPADDDEQGSDTVVAAPGVWTAAVPGKPDGEVDTRSR